MSFFRKAFSKIHSSDNSGAPKATLSTAAVPALSFQHDFGVAIWEDTSPRETTVVPMSISNSNSSRSPSSMYSLADRDGGFRTDGTAHLPPSKVTSGSYKEDALAPVMLSHSTKADEPKRRRPPKIPSTSAFLANLAGLKISSLDKDTVGSQVHDESVVSLPLPTPEPLSSNASTPNSLLPPPPSKARRRRRPQDSSIEAVVQSASATYVLPFSFDNSSSPAVADASMTRRLQEAGSQARLNSATPSESSSSVNVLSQKSAGSWPGDDSGPPSRIEANQFVIDHEPTPSNASTHFLPNGVDSLPTPPIFDFSYEPRIIHPSQEQLPTFNEDSDHILRQPNDIHPEVLQNNEAKPTSETQVADTKDIRDYPYSLVDDYVASASTPPPNPSSPLPQHSSATQQLEEEIRLLRSRLAESKARIDAFAEEKARLVQGFRQEVFRLSDNVMKLQQNEVAYHAKIEDMGLANNRLKTDRDEVMQQLKSQIDENEQLEKTTKELRTESLAFQEFKVKMRDNEIEYERLFKEKDSWQGQMDSMQQRLSDAERRVRCLDIVTRQKYEAKLDGSGSAVGRSMKLHFSPHVKGPSMDVVTSVTIFNEEVLQTASYIVEHLEESQSNTALYMPNEVARAKEIWGEKVVMMLQNEAQSSGRLNILLLKNCLEVFMTHWCAHIVEGWYPKQPSFSDVLVELSAHTNSLAYGRHVCGKQIKIIPTESAAPDFNSWVKDVVQDLTSILAVGGVKMPVLKTSLLPAKIEPLLKLAYNLRLALAERDICGGLEIAAPSPDVPFNPKFMEDAEEFALQKSRKRKVESPGVSWLDGGYIAGTNGIGLRRTLNGQPGVFEMVVMPKVSLIRVLETVF